MRSECMKFIDLFQKRLVVPVYQRSYSWSLEEGDQLIGDLHRSGQLLKLSPRGALYLGNVILYKSDNNQDNSLELVDGQQRNVTMMLLMMALNQNRALGDFANLYHPDNLVVHNQDAVVFEELLHTGESNSQSTMAQMYRMIVSMIKKMQENNDGYLNLLADGIMAAKISVLVLDETDNAQAVLQSFNGTGRQLTDFDLIKNSSLMRGGREATAQYENSWGQLTRYCEAKSIDSTEGLRRVLSYMQIDVGSQNEHRSLLHAVDNKYAQVSAEQKPESIETGIVRYLQRQQEFEQLSISEDLQVQLESMRGLPLAEAERYITLAQIARVEGKLNDAALLSVLQALESFVIRCPIVSIPHEVVCSMLDEAIAILSSEVTTDAETLAEDFIFQLFYSRESASTALRDFETRLSNAAYPDLNVWEYLLHSLEVKAARKPISFEGALLTHCLPSVTKLREHPEWMEFLRSQGNEDPIALISKYYDTLANFMLVEENLDYDDRFSEDPLAGLQKSRFSLTRGFKKLAPITNASMNDRLTKLVKVCERLWAFPKVSMKCASRNQASNWFYLTQITSTRGTKVVGVKVGDISYTGSAYKMLAKTWKQASWLIVKSLYECNTIPAGLSQLTRMLQDPRLQIDGQSIFVTREKANQEWAEATTEFNAPQYVQVTENCNMLLLNSADKMVKMLTVICQHLNCMDQVKIQLQ